MEQEIEKREQGFEKLNLLEQAKHVRKTAREFNTQVAIYYVAVLVALFTIWYLDILDEAPILGAWMIGSVGVVFLGVNWWATRIHNYKKKSLVDILKLYDEQIGFYKELIEEMREAVPEEPKGTSWVGRKLEYWSGLLKQYQDERAQVVEFYEEFI